MAASRHSIPAGDVSPFRVSAPVAHASLVTFTFDPPMAERLAAMAEAERSEPAYFDGIVRELLAGGESIVALSIFRNNGDVDEGLIRHCVRELDLDRPDRSS